ncbi:MAG TPA: branched-chain amino acid ABC transporter permease [Acidimicrobiia bacterium]|jgi:branched-chain amino acid transport system permease protein
MIALDIVITGLILGGIYALIAVGLSLQYGVGRVLNVAHGEFIILGALITYSLYTSGGLNPLLAIVILGPTLFLVGYALDRSIFNELRRSSVNEDAFEGRSLLVSFGLLFVVQNLMLLFWGAGLRGYRFLNTPVELLGRRYGLNRIVALVVAVTVSVGFYLFIRHTRLGKGIRAAAESPDMAEALGVNRRMVLALCFGLGAALAALAGVLYSMMFEIQASRGIELTVVAIVVVVVGGLGSITGSLLGGFVLGLVIAVVNYFDPSLSLVAFYLIFSVVLLVKPSGLLGRRIHAD